MIVTAADEAFVPGVRLFAEFFYKRKQPAPLRVYNLGFDVDASGLLNDFPQMEIVDFDYPKERLGWQALAKPSVILHAVEDAGKALWIDADCVPNCLLRLPWNLIKRRPFFTSQGKYGLDHHNDIQKLAQAGINVKPWNLRIIPNSGVCGFGVYPDRDDRKFLSRWKELCDNFVDGWCYLDQGPFMHLVGQYKHPMLWDGAKWNILGGVVGRTKEETVANMPNGIRHFAGRAKPWLSWSGQLELNEIQTQIGVKVAGERPPLIKTKKPVTVPKDIVKSRPKINVAEWGVGSVFKSYAKLRPCQRCDNTMKKMNLLGPAGCENSLKDIVKEIKNNASAYNAVTRAVSKIPGIKTLTGCVVDALVRKSIAEVRDRPCKLVTSLSLLPHHRLVQGEALDSWKRVGFDIVSVNRPSEIESLSKQYVQVDQWIEDDDKKSYYPVSTPRINSLAKVATSLQSDIFLINSDIEIHGDPSPIKPVDDSILCGVRANYHKNPSDGLREEWGIDSFYLTPEMADSLPEIPFCIGKPMWDYWVPFHFRDLGRNVQFIQEPIFFHKAHDIHWSQRDWILGYEWLNHFYRKNDSDMINVTELRRSLGS